MSGDLVPVDQELVTIERVMREDARTYWCDPDMQRRYGALLQARDKGGVPAAHSPQSAEIAQLEKAMRPSDPGYREYLRTGQGRYRELTGARDDTSPALADLDHARQDLPSVVVQEWSGSSLGFAGQLMRGREFVGDVIACIPDPALAQEFEISVTTLPESARAAMLREAVAGVPGYAKPATQDQVDTFAALGDEVRGQILHWGSQAPRRVGIIIERLSRAVNAMTAPDRATFQHWFDNISAQEIGALTWVLSGSTGR